MVDVPHRRCSRRMKFVGAPTEPGVVASTWNSLAETRAPSRGRSSRAAKSSPVPRSSTIQRRWSDPARSSPRPCRPDTRTRSNAHQRETSCISAAEKIDCRSIAIQRRFNAQGIQAAGIGSDGEVWGKGGEGASGGMECGRQLMTMARWISFYWKGAASERSFIELPEIASNYLSIGLWYSNRTCRTGCSSNENGAATKINKAKCIPIPLKSIGSVN